ncbi:hypothetical protein J2S98_004700 [Arthrobacter oryzae]|nr:hypothetical protein [Arthrobacter oryzae]MDP9989510.1 hypothetical protein [Arthrobacter oryzae]
MVGEPGVLRDVGDPVHPQSQQLTELHYSRADPAGGPGDQDNLPAPDPGSTGECLIGNQVVQGHGHHLALIQVGGDPHHRVPAHEDVLCVSARLRQHHHPIPRGDGGDPFPHGVHHADRGVAGGKREPRRIRRQSLAHLYVNGTHAAGLDGDPYLTPSEFRERAAHDFQYLRTARPDRDNAAVLRGARPLRCLQGCTTGRQGTRAPNPQREHQTAPRREQGEVTV